MTLSWDVTSCNHLNIYWYFQKKIVSSILKIEDYESSGLKMEAAAIVESQYIPSRLHAVTSQVAIQACLILQLGYVPLKHRTDWVQNSHLEQCISWDLGIDTLILYMLVNIQTCRVCTYCIYSIFTFLNSIYVFLYSIRTFLSNIFIYFCCLKK
jgi:hypothetical protein